jgi:hypothetical protein
MWSDVVSLCGRTCSVFPFYRFMGLDVGIGANGPVIVEVEADPHSLIQLYCRVGLRPVLESLAQRARDG